MFFSSLSSDEENFCATVPKDGRSYSPTLFSQTLRVLKKINKPGDMIVAFEVIADKIKVSSVYKLFVKDNYRRRVCLFARVPSLTNATLT